MQYNRRGLDPVKYSYESCVERMTRAIVSNQVKMNDIISPEIARKRAITVCEMIYGDEQGARQRGRV